MSTHIWAPTSLTLEVGLFVLASKSISYYDYERNRLDWINLDEATVFVAWERLGDRRFVLGDDFGHLYLLQYTVRDSLAMQDWTARRIGQASRASVLVNLSSGLLLVGSHHGNSQLVRLSDDSIEVISTLPNLGPVTDLLVMDMGSKPAGAESNDFSSGQLRLVTGSGAFGDGSLRSVRSGIGLRNVGRIPDLPGITALFGLNSDPTSDYVDTLVAACIHETCVFRFDAQGNASQLSRHMGLSLSQTTLLATNLRNERLLQVTPSKVLITNARGGAVMHHWSPPEGADILLASANDTRLFIYYPHSLVVLDLGKGLEMVKHKALGQKDHIACLALSSSEAICFVGCWYKPIVSVCHLSTLETIADVDLVEAADREDEDFDPSPRSMLVANVLEGQPPTVFVAMTNGRVVTFALDSSNHTLYNYKRTTLGSWPATLTALPRRDGLFNVLVSCDTPTLIHGYDRRLIYSALPAEKAIIVCSFHSQAFPGGVAIATTQDLRISLLDEQRSTHTHTLPLQRTARRMAYAPDLKAFGVCTVFRTVFADAELMHSALTLVSEVSFREIAQYSFAVNELVESVIYQAPDPSRNASRGCFFVAITDLATPSNAAKGRVVLFYFSRESKLEPFKSIPFDGSVPRLAMIRDVLAVATTQIVDTYLTSPLEISLTLQVTPWTVRESETPNIEVHQGQGIRGGTIPSDICVQGGIFAYGDGMRSISLMEYAPPRDKDPFKLTEVARHRSALYTSAVASYCEGSFLVSDEAMQLCTISRHKDDPSRMFITSGYALGQRVNRIKSVDMVTPPEAIATPKAVLGTVSAWLHGRFSSATWCCAMRATS